MNELEKAYNGIEDAIGSLDYEGNYDVDTPRESLEYIKIYINNLQSKIDKAIKYYETHQQECVIGRNKDDKLIKDYYLPAQCSKKLYEFLKEDK